MGNMPRIERIRAFALRAEVAFGPSSALAEMPVRNALIVEITDSDGATGWGEVWCNFPPRGNVSRAMLLEDAIAPLVLGKPVPPRGAIVDLIEKSQQRMIIHTAEPGAYGACLSGMDMCLCDLEAKRHGKPLAHLINADASNDVGVYASTPSFAQLEKALPVLRDMGHDSVKLKIGYGKENDLEILDEFADHDCGLALCVDANQAWDLATAKLMCSAIAKFNPLFVEEPLLATAPLSEWAQLAQSSSIPIAAGENIVSSAQFAEMVEKGGLSICQPDVAKWSGFSGAWQTCQNARRQGARTFAHYMGSAIGLAASLHLIAADNRQGRVELDANENPLRSLLTYLDLTVRNGKVTLPTGIGLGVEPDMEIVRHHVVAQFDLF